MFSKTPRSSLTLVAMATLGLGALSLSATAQAGNHGRHQSASATPQASASIVDTVSRSSVHTTLLAAVSAAGLADTLASPGPFTVFAPTNAAFARLPAGTVDTLLRPENRAALANVLTYHVVSGRVTAADLTRMIAAGRGSAQLTTVSGGQLTARIQDGKVVVVDANGGVATVTQADLMQSNGVIHVTDAVSVPR